MRAGGWRTANPISRLSSAQGEEFGRWLSRALIGSGALLLLIAVGFAVHALLKGWLVAQDRYLLAADVAPLPVMTMRWMAPYGFDATPLPGATAAVVLTSVPVSTPTSMPTPSPTAMLPSGPVAAEAPVLDKVRASALVLSADAQPQPTDTAVPVPPPPSPAQIRIPSLNINRSVIPLARVRDEVSGFQTWDTDKLFRPGRKDLVGHSEGSAYPGQGGNMVLVGHNSGSGNSGVFNRLDKLKRGRKVYVVDSTGETFVYRVTTIEKVDWRRQNLGELTRHLGFLAPGGPERLTLVSCAGANVQPFPERIYVVAEPLD